MDYFKYLRKEFSMKKVLFTMIAALLVFSGSAIGQYTWTYDSDFYVNPGPHGVVVDPAGKIWIGFFNASDTLITANNDTIPVSAIFVFNPDGTQADFSPISVLTVNGVADTLWRTPPRRRCRGVSLHPNGNIMYSTDDGVYIIDYQTGEALAKLQGNVGVSYTEAAVDENGFIYIAGVVPGGAPIEIYDENLDLYSFVLDTNTTISRSLIVTPDGKDVYHGAIYPGVGVIHYHSDDGPDGVYTVVDTINGDPNREMWGQCLDWDPWGMIWVGTYWDVPETGYKAWYALDPNNAYAIVDTFGTPAGNPSEGEVPPPGDGLYAPRGVAFYQDGNTWVMLTADFDGGVVKKWTNDNPVTGIFTVDNGVIHGFELLQNYPNPFNPSTSIPFQIEKAGLVELKVYNVMGREIATLVNQKMAAGFHTVHFDASNLPTGKYFYRLKVDGQLQTKQMTLMK